MSIARQQRTTRTFCIKTLKVGKSQNLKMQTNRKKTINVHAVETRKAYMAAPAIGVGRGKGPPDEIE
jgi:hypothetical protein